ncbi:MAG: hypothetical protein JNJ82_13825 [Opitutaceae bacterium]|nr:hypothetical protein [Opitutaceae bacterium]
MASFCRSLVCRAGWLLALAWLVGGAARAQLPGALPFTDTLLTVERDAIGLAKLAPDEINALNDQVEREVKLARQGNIKGFAVPFTQRRKPTQRTAAGLSRLNEPELRALDEAISKTVALPTIIVPSSSMRPRRDGVVDTAPLKPKVHGEVSFTVGMGSGGSSFYGGSMTVVHEDPRGFTAAIQISQYRGKGFYYADDTYDRSLLRR